MRLSKKMWVVILCVLLAIIATVYFMMVEQQGNERLENVNLDNGDRISFQKIEDYTSSTGYYDKRYSNLTEKEFANAFPEKKVDKVVVTLPEKKVKLKHSYQLRKDENSQHDGKYDEIYQWETQVYEDAQSKILYIKRNKGLQMVVADRGYMELSFYKDAPQRVKLKTGETLEEVKSVKSVVNGKTALVSETLGEFNSGRKCYLAEIRNIDGKGTEAFFTADNVTREDFIVMLETLVGRDYPMTKKIGGAQDDKEDSTEAFAVAKEEIACRQLAEEIVFNKYIGEIESNKMGYNLGTEYYPQTKELNGKKYNIHCSFFVYNGISTDWYMEIEKSKNGEFVEIGKTLVITEK